MDKVYKQTVTIKVFNTEYPCSYVSFNVMLNSPISFTVNLLGFKDKKKEVNKLTVGTVTKLAAALQNKIYEDPKKATCEIKASAVNKNDLKINGIITSVSLNATTHGGLSLTIAGTSPDALMNMYNGEIYSTSISAVEMSKKQIVRSYGQDKAMAWINKPLQQSLITDRISGLLQGISEKFPEYIKTFKNSEQEKKIAQSVHESNKKILNEQIKPFLSNSKPKVFGGVVDITKQPITTSINNGLCSYFFNNGSPFLSTLINMVNRDFALWYVALPKDGWKSGELREQVYGNENATKDIKVPINSISFSAGNYSGREAPCKGVAVVAGVHKNAVSALGIRDTTQRVHFVYPEKAVRDWGNYITYQAPNWLTVDSLDAKIINQKDTFKQLQQGKSSSSGRSTTKVKELVKADEKKKKEDLDYYYKILEYLSEKFYFRSLLQSSTITVSGPYWGTIDANVGDMINLSSESGGKICKGILQSVNYAINSSGESNITLTLIAAQLSGVKIK
jgi:hypothetical protein